MFPLKLRPLFASVLRRNQPLAEAKLLRVGQGDQSVAAIYGEPDALLKLAEQIIASVKNEREGAL